MYLFKENKKVLVKGFTLIELVLVVALILILSITIVPLSASFIGHERIGEEAKVLASTLRTAQLKSANNYNDSSFGVKFSSGQYVLYQGDSYLSRQTEEDQIFSTDLAIDIGEIDEINFAKNTGLPDSSLSLGLSLQNKTKTIAISSLGLIEVLE